MARSASPSNATPASAPRSSTAAARTSGWAAPQPSLMRPTLPPWGRGPSPSRTSRSISSSTSSGSLKPSPENSLMPLSSAGLWEADTTAPACAWRSWVMNATAGVGTMPTRRTSPPAEQAPAAMADSSIRPEIRLSRPMTRRGRSSPPSAVMAARPMANASSGVSSRFATPRTPSVPKSLVMRGILRGGRGRYRFEYWGAFRAFFSPYLRRSFSRASRERNPSFFRAPRREASSSMRARAMPWLRAPAWPVTPPPSSRATTSTSFSFPAARSGAVARTRWVRDGKYSSSERPLRSNRPVPGETRTRTPPSFRRPVASTFVSVSAMVSALPGDLAEPQLRRALGLVRVIGAGVHRQLAEHLTAQPSLRQHAADRLLDQPLGMALGQPLVGDLLQPARVLGVAVVHLLALLLPGEPNLGRVDHYDVVAHVDVWSPDGLVLAAEDPSDLRGQPPQDGPFGVDHVPAPLDVLRLRHVRLHRSPGFAPARDLPRARGWTP